MCLFSESRNGFIIKYKWNVIITPTLSQNRWNGIASFVESNVLRKLMITYLRGNIFLFFINRIVDHCKFEITRGSLLSNENVPNL